MEQTVDAPTEQIKESPTWADLTSNQRLLSYVSVGLFLVLFLLIMGQVKT